MDITPIDLQHKEFRRGLRGYRETDVQDYLRAVARALEELITENAQLKEQVDALRQRVVHYERMEETMHNALLLAQKAADESRRVAEKQADAIIREAEERRRAILKDARERCAIIERDLEQLRQQRAHFEIEFTTLLRSHLERVEQRDRPMAEPHSASLTDIDEQRPSPDMTSGTRSAAGGQGGSESEGPQISRESHDNILDWRQATR